MARKTVESCREDLEEAAIQTYMEVMGNTQYVPEVRILAAERALRALGKAEPARAGPTQVVLNFGDHLGKSLMGIGRTLELMKPAPDATSEVDDDPV